MESEPESPINDQLGISLPSPADETPSLPQSYAFTVHFDCDSKQRNTVDLAAKFSRRHIRNLSLPISKVYENKVNNGSGLNGKTARKAGNHSEGYFSSDPDDESKPKLYEMKLKNAGAGGKSSNAAQEKRPPSEPAGGTRDGDGEEAGSDVASETGTYTIDKDSPEVTTARHSIDAVFGLVKTTEVTKSQTSSEHSNHSTSATWVNDWVGSTVVEHSSLSTNSGTNSSSSSRNSVTGVSVSGSKIPSPVNHRPRQPPLTQPMKVEHSTESIRTSLLRKSYPASTPTQDVSPLETESYLRATERAVSALAARMSLSMDSGGESDAENSLGNTTNPSPAANGDATPANKYNRAFSLRRGRLDEPKKPLSGLGAGVTPKARVEPVVKAVAPRVVRRETTPTSFARTDVGRFSMRVPRPLSQVVASQVVRRQTTLSPFARTNVGRYSMHLSRPLSQSPVVTPAKKEVVKKKSSGSGGSARSNSTLSSKEVDFQNWKRRTKYDPMKAAAEGKKKEAAKKQPPASMTQSTNSTITTPKSPVNPVLRSASFHGTRQLIASSSDEEEITLSAEDEDWPVLPAPRSSREPTPQGSRASLYSNNSNSPTPPLRNRPKLEGVDTLVISAISGLSSKLKGSSCNLLNKLRYLYDDESPKNHQLGSMIEQLEASEPGSPQVKSPSRELATTLRNLKRLESMLKVLDEVLFDEEEFE